jgi:hypothetical protein
VLLLVMSAPVGAVTPEALTGDYTLVALDIDYGGSFPPAVDETDFPTLNGYLSATGMTLVFEHAGQDDVNFNTYSQITAGQYQLSGNTATVTRAGGAAVEVQIVMPNANTVEVTGSGVTVNNPPQSYNYTYRFTRDETYYTQAALDAAVAEATAGLLSPAACDQMIADAVAEATAGLLSPETCGKMIDDAVADALANVEPVRVPVVIPIGD